MAKRGLQTVHDKSTFIFTIEPVFIMKAGLFFFQNVCFKFFLSSNKL